MRTILVLGAAGMLGHQLLRQGDSGDRMVGTVRDPAVPPALADSVRGAAIVPAVDVLDPTALARLIDRERPDVVVNAVGVVKQRSDAKVAIPSIETNALLPHRLAALSRTKDFRLIQISTDCVFSGRDGPYNEDRDPDPVDLYGRSKLLGEVVGAGALTLRTSIIGHEFRGHLALVDWFLSQAGRGVDGYAGALYTGVTTAVLAEVVRRVIADHPDLSGIWHVAGPAISKYALLGKLNELYGLGITLRRNEAFRCDRRLDGNRFSEATGWSPPDWDRMLQEMLADHQARCGGEDERRAEAASADI